MKILISTDFNGKLTFTRRTFGDNDMPHRGKNTTWDRNKTSFGWEWKAPNQSNMLVTETEAEFVKRVF